MTSKASGSPVDAQSAAAHSSEPVGRRKPPRGRPFEKGKSPNPGGRPKGYAEFRELCREKTPEAMEALVSMLSKRDSTAAMAARTLLEYGWGKPQSAPEDLEAVKEGGGGVTLLSRSELLAIAALPADVE